MKKQLTTLILAAFLIALWSGCSSKITISSDYDKNTDFTPYKSYSFYGWAKGSDKIINDITKKRLEDAVANELAKRGISYLESGGELTVSLFIQFDRQQGVTAYTDYYGRSPYGYGPGWGWGYGYTTTRYQEYDYLTGTLVIDIFDHQQKKLIWQGVGSKTVDENPNNREYGINKAVRGIMSKYPIKPSKQDK